MHMHTPGRLSVKCTLSIVRMHMHMRGRLTNVQVYLITTTWNETYVNHGATSKEAVTTLVDEVEELSVDDIRSCVKLDIPIVNSTSQTPDEATF